MGWVLSFENATGTPTLWTEGEGHTRADVNASPIAVPRSRNAFSSSCAKTPCTLRNYMHENNALSTLAPEESDRIEVLMKSSNKATEQLAQELKAH